MVGNAEPRVHTYVRKSLSSAILTAFRCLWLIHGLHNRGATAFLDNTTTCNGCDFLPISDFRRTDADVTILGLINLATYTSLGKDPWFQPTSEEAQEKNTTVWYTPTNMSFVGCTEQYQLCHHAHCSPLTGLYPLKNAKNSVTQNEAQSALFDLLWKGIWGTNMEYLITFLGADVLRANEKLYRFGFLSSAPEPNHWHLEMENMHNVSLSFLQRRFIDFADPPALEIRPNLTIRDYLQPPGDQERFCNAMKIRSPNHTSFNMFKLGMVCMACGLVILTSLLLPVVVPRLPVLWRRSAATSHRSYRTAMWEEQNFLRLLERVLEMREMLEMRAIAISPVSRGHDDRVQSQDNGERNDTLQMPDPPENGNSPRPRDRIGWPDSLSANRGCLIQTRRQSI